MSADQWSVDDAGLLRWPDDENPDLPYKFTESDLARAMPDALDRHVTAAYAALADAVAARAEGSPMPETEGARAEGYAPAWVQSVTPAEVVRQRRLGWPDFHPEDFCHVCGHRIGAPWFVSAETWGKVFDGHAGIVCPPCFTTLYAAATGSDRVGWELRVDHQEGDS